MNISNLIQPPFVCNSMWNCIDHSLSSWRLQSFRSNPCLNQAHGLLLYMLIVLYFAENNAMIVYRELLALYLFITVVTSNHDSRLICSSVSCSCHNENLSCIFSPTIMKDMKECEGRCQLEPGNCSTHGGRSRRLPMKVPIIRLLVLALTSSSTWCRMLKECYHDHCGL